MSKQNVRNAVIPPASPAPAASAPAQTTTTQEAPATEAPATTSKKAKRAAKIDPATGKPVRLTKAQREERALSRWARKQGVDVVLAYLPADVRAKISASVYVQARGEAIAASLEKRAKKFRDDAAKASPEISTFLTRLNAVKAQVEQASKAAILAAGGLGEPTPASDGAAL